MNLPEAILSFADGAIYNSLGFWFVAMGALVSIRYSGYPDLTIDGSFTIGAATYAVLSHSGYSPLLVLPIVVMAGGVAGAMTAGLHLLGIGRILAGIMMYVLLVVSSPYLTGASSVGLLKDDHILNRLQTFDTWLTRELFRDDVFSLHIGFSAALGLLLVMVASGITSFFQSPTGIRIRYVGSSEAPNLLSPFRRKFYLLSGLAIGNSLVAIGGAIEAQRSGGFSQNMGIGVVLIAITILVLAENLGKRVFRADLLTVRRSVVATLGATTLYFIAVQALLISGFSSVDVRLSNTLLLLTALLVVRSRTPDPKGLF